MENLFRRYSQPLKGGRLNSPLIKIRGHQCERCKNTEWLGQPITLQVHHKDGDRCNNELNNLELLCPNCHSYTDNFGIKNNKHEKNIEEKEIIEALKNSSSIRQALLSLKMSDAGANYTRVKSIIEQNNIIVGENIQDIPKETKKHFCLKCGKPITGKKYCIECSYLMQRTVERPSREELKRLIRNYSFVEIGKQFNVTDNAIRRWCDFEKLPRTKQDIKKYSDLEWEKL